MVTAALNSPLAWHHPRPIVRASRWFRLGRLISRIALALTGATR
jgi:hypothetical protein